MMKAAMLAVVALCVLRAAPPVPRQAGSNGYKNSENQKDTGTVKSATSGKPQSTIEQHSASAQGETRPCTSRDEHGPVEVRVSSVKVDKDWADYIYIVMSGVLVIVGLFTFWAIRYQAVETARAARATEKAAEAAERNTGLVIGKERPRVSVVVKNIDLSLPFPKDVGAHYIDYLVYCYGVTPAFVKACDWKTEITSSFDRPPKEPWLPMLLPSILYENRAGLRGRAYLPTTVLSGPEIDDINEGRSIVHFWGIITYGDVFENLWETPFHYTYAKSWGNSHPIWSKHPYREDSKQ